tara:strand:+ start:20621 stop:21277 length:657 start_codon:yes stop_codon:yes gene_type:complete
MTESTKKNIYKAAIVVIIMLLIVIAKVYYRSMDEFDKGEEAFKKQDMNKAITHFQRSIHWYTPFNKYVAGSAEKLWEIGNRAEKQNNTELALLAYRNLRSSFYAVRSFYTPYKEWINKCDERISSLVAVQETPFEPEKKKSFEQRKAEALKILKTDKAPHVGWSIFLEIGFIGWVTCTVMFILKVFTGIKGFEGRKALFWGPFIILFYAMWIIGMMNA